jgi:hypothetical protein
MKHFYEHIAARAELGGGGRITLPGFHMPSIPSRLFQCSRNHSAGEVAPVFKSTFPMGNTPVINCRMLARGQFFSMKHKNQ